MAKKSMGLEHVRSLSNRKQLDDDINQALQATTYHVTRTSGVDVHGHDTRRCDPGGCSGDELFLGDLNRGGDIRRGDLITVRNGKLISVG